MIIWKTNYIKQSVPKRKESPIKIQERKHSRKGRGGKNWIYDKDGNAMKNKLGTCDFFLRLTLQINMKKR